MLSFVRFARRRRARSAFGVAPSQRESAFFELDETIDVVVSVPVRPDARVAANPRPARPETTYLRRSA
jgi:hypothetical protein